jgi:subtilisin family serine protease
MSTTTSSLHSPFARLRSWALAAGAALALAATPLLAQSPSGDPSGPTAPAARIDPGLIAIPPGGTARVIVGLRLPWKTEGLATVDERGQQRLAIAAAQTQLMEALRGTGAELVRRYQTTPFQVLTVTPAALGRLLTSDLVSSIAPDRLLRPTLAQSVPLIQADQAWAIGYTGAGIAVAILDTGIEATHSFFGGRVAAEACFSSNEPGVSTSLCPNGQATQVGSGSSSPATCAGLEGCDHGTHVAGIAAGSGSSFSGVAKGASLIGVKVFSRITASACGGAPCLAAFTSDIDTGLEHVLSLKDAYLIASVNMSLGDGIRYTSQAQCDLDNASTKSVIDNLRSVGIATVIASGNESYPDAVAGPACVSSAVAVGSTTKQDAISSFSDSSPLLDLLAPGSSINSSITGNAFGVKSGTSMAAPHVAGAWAILKQLEPTASVAQVLSAFQSSGLGITDPRNGLTRSRIRVKPALDVILGPPPAISIGNVTVTEGDAGSAPATFNVTLSSTYLLTVTVDYATATGTAATGTDFLASQGKLVFPPGATTHTISVPVLGDFASEGTETFVVNLSNPTNATLTAAQGTGTILDNDGAGFAISDLTVAEPRTGTANAVFTVTLSPAPSGTVTVGFHTTDGTAVAPGDYTASSGTLTFTTGQTSQTITVPVNADAVADAGEIFYIDLVTSSGPAIARARGTATVYDPGFYTVTPCRVLDTRVATQGPALSAGSTRTVVVGSTCGIPPGVRAASLNVTVVSPTGAGDLRIYPAGVTLPLVSAINYGVGQTRANNASVALSPAGLLSVFCEQATGTVDLIVDVNGYFE